MTEQAVNLYNYSKLAITFGNEAIQNILKEPENTHNYYIQCVKLATIQDIDTSYHSFSRDIMRNFNPYNQNDWNIDFVRQNAPFFARMTAWTSPQEFLQYILKDWAGISLTQKRLSKKYRHTIQNHPKIELICEFMKFSSCFFHSTYNNYSDIIKLYIPQKKIAEDYLDICLQKPLISFQESPILRECIDLKNLVNLKENKYFINMMNREDLFERLTADTPHYRMFEALEMLHFIGKKELFGKILLKLTEKDYNKSYISNKLIQQMKSFGYLDELKIILEDIKESRGPFLINPFNINAFNHLYETFPEKTIASLKNVILSETLEIDMKLQYLALIATHDTSEIKSFIKTEMQKIDLDKIEKSYNMISCLSIFLRLENKELIQKYFDLSVLSLLEVNDSLDDSQEFSDRMLFIFQQKFKDMKALEELKTKEPFDIGKLFGEYLVDDDD